MQISYPVSSGTTVEQLLSITILLYSKHETAMQVTKITMSDCCCLFFSFPAIVVNNGDLHE